MKISVITVCFNSAATIRKTIESVLSQKNVSVEYIIIDGGSSDDTLETIRQFRSDIDVVISEPDDGIYDAMNKGVRIATGDIIAILNSDDWYLRSDVLSDVETVFKSAQHVDLVSFGVDFVRASDLSHVVRVWPSIGIQRWMLFLGLMPPHPGVFVKRSAYERLGEFVDDMQIAGDFEFLVRLFLRARINYQTVDSVAVRMRLGGVSTSGFNSVLNGTREMRSALERNGFVYFNWLVWLRLPIKFFLQLAFPSTLGLLNRIGRLGSCFYKRKRPH